MKKGGSTALAAGLLILMILFGNALTLPFRVAGFGVNMYIVSMALFAVVLFGLRIKEGRLREKEDRGVMFLYGFTLLWLAAGIVLLLWHRTAVSEGLRQLVQIALGAASAFSLIECLHRGLDKEMIYFWIRIAVLIYIIIAMFEIAGGVHLHTSHFSDPTLYRLDWSLLRPTNYLATATYFNENDLCACLAVLTPFCFPQKNYSWKKNLGLFFLIMMVILIEIHDDAWICFLGLTAAALIYMIVTRPKLPIAAAAVVSYYAVYRWGRTVLHAVIVFFYELLGKEVPPGLHRSFGFVMRVVSKASEEAAKTVDNRGTITYRVETYKEAFCGFFESHGLGLGPYGVDHHLQTAGRPYTVGSPHSFWLELLCNYGVIIFLLFAALCIFFIVRLIKNYKETKDLMYLILICADISLAMACNSPSRFVELPYYWILLALTAYFCQKPPAEADAAASFEAAATAEKAPDEAATTAETGGAEDDAPETLFSPEQESSLDGGKHE